MEQELDVPDLHRLAAVDRPDDSRTGFSCPRAVERDPGLVEVDPVERRREAVE